MITRIWQAWTTPEQADTYENLLTATIFPAINRPADALAELERVRDAAPREATVHFAMGKVLKRLGRPQEAMKCFLTAMDLDPKDNQLIKSAMDKLDEPDIDEEHMTVF